MAEKPQTHPICGQPSCGQIHRGSNEYLCKTCRQWHEGVCPSAQAGDLLHMFPREPEPLDPEHRLFWTKRD